MRNSELWLSASQTNFNKFNRNNTGREIFFRPVSFIINLLKYDPRSGYINYELRIPNSELN